MIFQPLYSLSAIIADNSQKLSQLPRTLSISADDLYTFERSFPKEVQAEILNEAISALTSDVATDFDQLLEICLEDGYAENETGTAVISAHYLINELKTTLENVRLRYSYSAKMQDLVKFILDKLEAAAGLSSMAYKEKWDYSRSWHEHDYSEVRVSALCSESPIAKVTISDSDPSHTKEILVGLPAYEAPNYKLYDIGEFKLLAVPNRQQMSTSDPNFDGWVYADGSTYSKEYFPKAYSVFNPSGIPPDSFNVPNIHDFIKLNGFSNSDENSFLSVHYENAISPHKHDDIDNNQLKTKTLQQTVDIEIPITNGANNKKEDSLHTGYQTQYSVLSALSVTINSNNLETQLTSTQPLNNDIESKPMHQVIPLMVYIGKKGEQ